MVDNVTLKLPRSHMEPVLTRAVGDALRDARDRALTQWHGSLDLNRSSDTVLLGAQGFTWRDHLYPYPPILKDRTVYFWAGAGYEPAMRYGASLAKLIPTEWGPPTFELDGVKMLPSQALSPYADAEAKTALVAPRGKVILDCCGGLGYFAAACLASGAQRVESFELNNDVIWLRSLNPWSPQHDARLAWRHADVAPALAGMPAASFDAILHDPPRFSLAGELYSLAFYQQLARVLKPGGRMFHYTGAPNSRYRGRDLAGEVIRRLTSAGLQALRHGDGVVARK